MLENDEKDVKKIEDEIKSLEKTLDDIQSECPHNKYSVKYVTGTNSPKRVCDNCSKDIGYADCKELRDEGFTQ